MTAPTKTKTKTPTQADMELERPNSLRDFLKEELANDNAYRVRHGKEPEQHTDKDIDELMSQLYAWIEKEALRRYSSNAPWAIKEFIVKNILQEEVVNEYNFQVASEISQPVEVWQNDPENFDPLQHFRLKLGSQIVKAVFSSSIEKRSGSCWIWANNNTFFQFSASRRPKEPTAMENGMPW